jgi:hypothetical protein
MGIKYRTLLRCHKGWPPGVQDRLAAKFASRGQWLALNRQWKDTHGERDSGSHDIYLRRRSVNKDAYSEEEGGELADTSKGVLLTRCIC